MKKLVPISLPDPIKHQRYEYVKILQSLNGLLLLCLKFSGEDRIDYVVFNPTTNQHRFVHLDRDRYQPRKMSLVSDPSKSEYYKLVMHSRTVKPFSLVSDPSKSEYYKLVMDSRTVKPFFSIYDSATHQWSHGLGREDVEFTITGALLHNLIANCLRLGDKGVKYIRIPEEGYDTFVCDSNEYLNMIQLKLCKDENKHCFRLGVMIDKQWVICKEGTLDFGSSSPIKALGMIREERMEDSVLLFHVSGRLMIYGFSDGAEMELVVDYMEDQFQFEYAHPFTHTFASV